MPTTHADWVAQGATTEPTTVAAEPLTPTPETTSAAPVDSGVAAQDAPSGAPGQPSDSAPVSGAAPTKAEIEALEAWLDEKGEQKLSIPLSAMVPRKVDGVETRIPLSQALKEHQLQAHHTKSMQAIAEQRRAFELNERKLELDRARMEAQQAVFQAEVDRFKAAQGDEEAMARLSADQERLRTDPEYKKLYDDALEHRMSKAAEARDTELAQFEESQSVADEGAAYITRVAAQYPGVDPADIQATISRMLRTGEMTIGPAEDQFNARTVDRLYQKEAAKLSAATAPVMAELEGLRKRLEALEAEKKNGAVVAALRAPTAPTTGAPSPRSPAPPSTSALPEPVAGETHEKRARAWINKGRA